MPYQGKSIANTFLALAARGGEPVDPLKLQKLMFYANGYYMAEHDGQPLINEYFEAWDYGPVIPTVYYEFREYRNGPILRYAYTWDERANQLIIAPPLVADADAENVIAWVWQNYKGFSGLELSQMTHKVGSPWHTARVRAGNHGMRNERLDLNETTEYFRSRLAA